MFNRILIALGIRKKVVPDTPARHTTDKLDFPESEITEAYASGRLPKHVVHVNRSTPGTVSSAQSVYPRPPKEPPPFRKRLDPQPSKPSDDIATQPFYNTPLSVIHDSPPCEVFAGKGGEFSGAGASRSWDSPSTSSSDTSSSSSDSGSSSSGSD